MSRPFRVWDTESKSFWQDINEGHVGCIGQLFLKPSGDFALRQNGIIIHESVFPGRFIRQDSTGLKDYHGKEIYESDDVNFNGRMFRVTWKYGRFIAITLDDNVAYELHQINEDCEVFGNLYESHSLLEDTP